ncbi:MAG: type II toxin-antitoxin system RelE/ParE family toxin [Bacteroidaceae bacterium]|nr:type II toxin-antitoxin system RelE/ParE family toxin [Bacteroidaceae bacterium]
MANYHLTHKAIEDLSNIWEYTVEVWSEQQADKYYNLIIDSFTRILENPLLLGLKYDEVYPGLFGLKVKKHIVFYQLFSNQDILIIRILHESMDYKRHFAKS